MGSPERVPILSVFPMMALVSGLCLMQPACADVYSYTDNTGMVKLSNVPTDSHFAVLVKGPAEPAATVSDKHPLTIADKAHYGRMVDEVARTYGLESSLLHAVISVESRYRPKVVSKKGAAGLMQLMPVITRRYGVADPFDPVQNVHGGAKYLRDLLKIYNNDMSLALAAYNAGPRAVAKYGNRIPPFRETVDYVPRVLGFYRKYQSELPPGNMLAASQADIGVKGRVRATPLQ